MIERTKFLEKAAVDMVEHIPTMISQKGFEADHCCCERERDGRSGSYFHCGYEKSISEAVVVRPSIHHLSVGILENRWDKLEVAVYYWKILDYDVGPRYGILQKE